LLLIAYLIRFVNRSVGWQIGDGRWEAAEEEWKLQDHAQRYSRV